jgi:LmbE family N-acetylglucosaminyl deacetylase
VATVVFLHAHPDDETVVTGGTMAGLAADGHRVVVVTATFGELGEVPEGMLDDGESVAERRNAELAASCTVLGVARQVFLGYHDSGMAGEPTNDRPGSFAAADVDEAAAGLASILTEESADVLVAYDEHGGYGHPDHIQVHRVGMRAAELAGTAAVYMATVDRDHMRQLAAESLTIDGEPPHQGTIEAVLTMGEPGGRITTEVDVMPWIDRKQEAMRAHASQIAEDSFFLALPEQLYRRVWGQEWYIRVVPPWDAPEGAPRESALALDERSRRGGGPAPAASGIHR